MTASIPFTLYPAIDLKDGACVRLLRGEMGAATSYNPDPADQAARFQAMGFNWLHVVDLNGAFDGQSTNAQAVRAILKAVSIPVQLGGGIRNRTHVENWLETGIARVILGTLALRNPPLVRELALAFPEKIVIGLDSNQGRVAVEGWAELSDMPARELACRFEDSGVAALIVTDISRDGTKTGVNVEFTQEIADAVTIPVIASGGVKSVADITALRASTGHQSITGTILGRALYEGDIDPAQALKAASTP